MFLILRNFDAMQHGQFSYYKIKFPNWKIEKYLNQPHVLIDLSNPIFSREGYLQQHWQKNFVSPWKRALSPVACAQPDKYVSGCEPTSDIRNF